MLLSHPRVVDAAVIGIPHHYSGEVPRAYVVLGDGVAGPSLRSQVESELTELVQVKKAKYKRLVGGIEFLAEIPKSASGKILRRVLKDSWRESHTDNAATEKPKL